MLKELRERKEKKIWLEKTPGEIPRSVVVLPFKSFMVKCQACAISNRKKSVCTSFMFILTRGKQKCKLSSVNFCFSEVSSPV